jgi:hypothetical protein
MRRHVIVTTPIQKAAHEQLTNVNGQQYRLPEVNNLQDLLAMIVEASANIKTLSKNS